MQKKIIIAFLMQNPGEVASPLQASQSNWEILKKTKAENRGDPDPWQIFFYFLVSLNETLALFALWQLNLKNKISFKVECLVTYFLYILWATSRKIIRKVKPENNSIA